MNTRIRTLSTFLFFICTAALVLVPVGVAIGVAFFAPERFDLVGDFPGVVVPTLVSPWLAKAVMLVGLLPVIPALYAVWQMRKLFDFYRCGETLSERCAGAILRIGAGVLAVLAASVIAHTLQVLTLTMANPPGHRALSIAFSSSDMALALAGGLLLVIGWVMKEAVDIAEENRGFI